MNLKERVYSTLVVSASERFNASFLPLLSESIYSPVRTVSSISEARRELTERRFDQIFINAPLPDDFGSRFAIDACDEKGAVVLLFVRSEMHDEIFNTVSPHGVFTLPRPSSKGTILTCLGWMTSARERIRKLEKKTLSIEERMKEIRMINRAKWLLIQEVKMSEPEAHHYIEKQAMDRCVAKRTIAEEIIQTYS